MLVQNLEVAMRRSANDAWSGSAPRIQAYATPMPDAPYLPLTGGCTTSMDLEEFLAELCRCLETQAEPHYIAYVWDSEREEADTYVLQDWEICRPESGAFEAVVILYYAPINTYLTIKKHMGDDMAEEYLEDIHQRDRVVEYCEQLLAEYEQEDAIARTSDRQTDP